LTLTLRDGTTQAITLTDTTTYFLGKTAGTKADLKAGLQAEAAGSIGADGSFTATKVLVVPSVVAGKVTGKTDSTITVTGRDNSAITIHVTAATTYRARGENPA